jgi:hypothetical protein
MNKAVKKLILWMWIGISNYVGLMLGLKSIYIISYLASYNDGAPFYEQNSYATPIHEIIILQIAVTVVLLIFGLVWAALVLILSERLLAFLQFPAPGNNKFSKLSLGLFKFALIVIIFGVSIGNISLVYDQIQGRAQFNR